MAHPRTRFIAAGIALLAVLGAVFVRNLTDFSVYYAAGRSLLAGRTDLYAPDFARGAVMDYRYLPIFILTFAPLSSAPYTVAAWVWHLLNTAAISLAVASIASIYTDVPYRRSAVWTVAFLAVVPYFASLFVDVNNSLRISATGMLIVVAVVLDTMKQLESQLLMRNYEGFIR